MLIKPAAKAQTNNALASHVVVPVTGVLVTFKFVVKAKESLNKFTFASESQY